MSDTEAQMQKLRQRFQARAASDCAAIIKALEAEDRPRLLHLAHGLAGVAGIFGYVDIGVRASALEEAVDVGAVDADVKELGQALIEALNRV